MRTDSPGHRQAEAEPTPASRHVHQAAPPDGTDRFVRWLTGGARTDASHVGVTGAALEQRARARRPVPPGFVVTVDAYLRALDQFGGRAALHARVADVDVRDRSALTRAARTCQALVRSSDMPAAVRRSVLGAYSRLACENGRVTPVVVRASPTPDDQASTSIAGMDLTFSDVRSGLELVDRIIDCWASRWSPGVVVDRAARGLTREPAMAVVVARQPGSAAGWSRPRDRRGTG
jgi:pyruvate, water dikinase